VGAQPALWWSFGLGLNSSWLCHTTCQSNGAVLQLQAAGARG
jgi:hypothetical protein